MLSIGMKTDVNTFTILGIRGIDVIMDNDCRVAIVFLLIIIMCFINRFILAQSHNFFLCD